MKTLNLNGNFNFLDRKDMMAIFGGGEEKKCSCSCDNHEGSWQGKCGDSGTDTACRDADNNTPGPYTCASK